ncbi:MAG: hypothetical protein ACE5KF_03335 [Kiloniellaceae bacterium]
MGEIVDLEHYRRQRKRRTLGSGAAGERRHRDEARPERARPATETAESGNAQRDRRAKIDRDDPSAE